MDMANLITTSLVGLQISITTYVLGFTPQDSFLRSSGLLLMIYIAYLQAPYIIHLDNPIARGFLANAPFVLTILYIDKVLLHRWTFAVKGPTSSIGGLSPAEYDPAQGKKVKPDANLRNHDDTLQRLQFGLDLSLQSRFPGTRWPVKNIPSFHRGIPAYIPSKAEFLRAKIASWILYLLVLDLAGLFNKGRNNDVTFASGSIPLYSRLASISGEEAMTRILVVISFWIFQYIVIEIVYGAFAIMAVASGVSTVETWPPMFGFVGDSYSLRQFWG